jgi:hypothetical protein
MKPKQLDVQGPNGERIDLAAAAAPAPANERKATALVGSDSSPYHMDVQRVIHQTRAIQDVMRQVMKPGVHYGVIPGTEKRDANGVDISKPSLWQPGADLLCVLFRLRPKYEETYVQSAGFFSVRVRTNLIHIPTGEVWGEGLGSANSRETRYLNQTKRRVCPNCGKATIFKSKDPGGGWFCWRAKEGCGAQFPDNDPAMSIDVAQVNDDKVHDLENTILKIACKRSKVGGVLTCTAASEIFTQDLEDMEELPGDMRATPPAASTSKAASPAAGAAAEGPKRASPIQVKNLMYELMQLEIGVKEANDMGLTGRDKEAAILRARHHWVSGMLGRKVESMSAELMADETASLIEAAKAGEFPPAPNAGGRV